MRAFLGQFDSVSGAVFALGAAIGAIWLVALDLGVTLTAAALIFGAVVLIIRHRWLEIGLLAAGIGLVAQVGYWIVGPPPVPEPPPLDPDLPPALTFAFPLELVASGLAGLLLFGGLGFMAVVALAELGEGRRRERLEARHEARRARRGVAP
jgi:hypothetical protein